MSEIRFDLGISFSQLAKFSGAHRFVTTNVAGAISYEITPAPTGTVARFIRTGFEIAAVPIFGFSMYADSDLANDLSINEVSLQFDDRTLRSHDAGRGLIKSLVKQFSNGKWKRHIDDHCPAVTGRSSVLDEEGNLDHSGTCAIDPNYVMPEKEWIDIMRSTQSYQWMGDGVLAKLRADYSSDTRGITYNIYLDFKNYSTTRKMAEKNQARALKKGDALGWNSSAIHAENLKRALTRVQILEANSLKRGDSMVKR